MARTTDEIIATMDATQASQPALSGLTSTSQTAIYKLFKYIFAQAAQVLESLWDRKQQEIEDYIDAGVAPSTAWLRRKTFEFQYDSTVPQVLQLVDLVPTYVPVDESKRIITRCCVSQITGLVTVHVAKNEPPEKLTTSEKNSLQAYFTNVGNGTNQAVGIGYGGQSIQVVSLDPDLLFIEAEITYTGNASIQDEIILAIENYISTLGQNPIIRIVEVIAAMRSVVGFVDVEIANMKARPASIPWGGPGDTVLVDANEVLFTEYSASAGYMIGETTAGQTFADKLTFTAI